MSFRNIGTIHGKIGLLICLASILVCKAPSDNNRDLFLSMGLYLLADRGGIAFSYNGASQTNLANTAFTTPGDGPGDGFSDHFATPAAVAIKVCGIALFKSTAKGGPVAGQESTANADIWIPANGTGTEPPAEGQICSSGQSITIGEQNPIGNVPLDLLSHLGPDHDRMMVLVSHVVYAFSPNDVGVNRRLMQLDLMGDTLAPVGIPLHQEYTDSYRVMVRVPPGGSIGMPCQKLASDPESALYSTPNWYFRQSFVKLNQEPGTCSSELTSLAVNGQPSTVGVTFNPVPAFSCSTCPGFAYSRSTQVVRSPNTFGDTLPPYVRIVRKIEPGTNKFQIGVNVKDALFWDSNSADNNFDPDSDPGDRGTATTSAGNLNDTSLKNIIVSPPRYQ